MTSSPFSPAFAARILIAGSITKLPADVAGKVIVSGSHGGALPGALAIRAGARAVLLNDAGVGLEGAGIGALALCQEAGMAAATVSHASCKIGDADDMVARGVVSHANGIAAKAGVTIGQSCIEAAEALATAPQPEAATPPEFSELREMRALPNSSRILVLVDSASMVMPEDAGQVVLTGSHGGLIGGNPAFAIKAPVFAAFYNDAGVGMDNWGLSRLPALDAQGIAGLTLAHTSCRIGDARSGFETGVVSHVNEQARKQGMKEGMAAAAAVGILCG